MKKYLKISFLVLSAFIIGTLLFRVVHATTKLTPSGDGVTDQMYSLTDIYNLATDGTPADEKTGDKAPTPGSIEPTGHTLTEVYDAVATALANATPTLTWQADPSLSLCWSHNQYEIDNGCVKDSGFIDASQAQDGSLLLGAKEYCQYLNANGTTLATTAQNVWHLPTIQEYTSITDYTRYGANSATAVTGFAEDSIYWSSTQGAENTGLAWSWNTWGGNTNGNGKNNQFRVRCAH